MPVDPKKSNPRKKNSGIFKRLGILLNRLKPNGSFRTTFNGGFYLQDRRGEDILRFPKGKIVIKNDQRAVVRAGRGSVETKDYYTLFLGKTEIALQTDEDSWKICEGERTHENPWNKPHLKERVVNYSPDAEAYLFLGDIK